MRILKWLWLILKDEVGMDPGTAMLISSGIMGGSTLLGGLLGKNKERNIEPFPGYFGLGQSLAGEIQKRLGQPGTRYSGSFNIPQPGIEAQTESILSGKLGALPTAAQYKGKVEASKTQQIAREKERAGVQQEEEKNMYNRLGLASSTPWLERAGELGEESLMRQRDIETGMDIYGLDYGLQADKLAEDIANQYLTQGQVLGGRQRGYEQYPIQMNFEDWLRSYQEPYQWAGLGTSLMGGQTPAMISEPNLASNLAQSGQDIGSLLMMYQLLGGGGGKTTTPPTSPAMRLGANQWGTYPSLLR